MERLTHKIVYDNEHCQYVFDLNQECKVGTKLGELEDVLEKWDIENLDKFVEEQIAKKRELNNIFWKMEGELAELKQKAIVPKFSLGQEVWAISVYRKDCVDNFIIQEICFCSPYGLYYKTNMDINLYEYYFDIFATKEEAEQKLAEIKGGSDGHKQNDTKAI